MVTPEPDEHSDPDPLRIYADLHTVRWTVAPTSV